MPINVGTLVRPFVDASFFTKADDTNFQCDGDKTDVCVGIITNFSEGTVVYASVKWLQNCKKHKAAGMVIEGGWFNIDFLWEIGQIH